MTSTIDLDQLLATITHEARVALDTAECAIDTYDPDAETITVVAFQQRTPEPARERWVGRDYSLDEYAFDRRLLHSSEIAEERVSDPSMDERNRADMLENGEKTLLNVPLVYEERPIGFLVFIETEVERRFTGEERQLAAALGEQAAAAIHQRSCCDRPRPRTVSSVCSSGPPARSVRALIWTRCSTPWRVRQPSCSGARSARSRSTTRPPTP